MPSLFSRSENETPGILVGTTIRDLFECGLPSPVLASRHRKSAWVELVIHILLPLMR